MWVAIGSKVTGGFPLPAPPAKKHHPRLPEGIKMRIIACLVLFALAMFFVRMVAHGIVDGYGALAGLAVILAMYGAARWYERRKIERARLHLEREATRLTRELECEIGTESWKTDPDEPIPAHHWRVRD